MITIIRDDRCITYNGIIQLESNGDDDDIIAGRFSRRFNARTVGRQHLLRIDTDVDRRTSIIDFDVDDGLIDEQKRSNRRGKGCASRRS